MRTLLLIVAMGLALVGGWLMVDAYKIQPMPMDGRKYAYNDWDHTMLRFDYPKTPPPPQFCYGMSINKQGKWETIGVAIECGPVYEGKVVAVNVHPKGCEFEVQP